MADKYVSTHYGQDVDTAVSKAMNPSTTFTSEDEGKLADAKAVGELVNTEKERAEATYLPYDGYSQLARVGEADVADNLTPFSGDSGTSQNTPFILQGSGCANGEEQADTGSYCQLKEKRGNTVVVNQLVDVLSVGGNTNGLIYSFGSNGAVTISGTTDAANFKNALTISSRNNHKLLMVASPQFPEGFSFGGSYDYNRRSHFLIDAADVDYVRFAYNSEVTVNYAGYVNVFDLTLWFGSNDKIPTHLLNHPEDFFRYYQGDLSYNVGTLTDCNGRYLKTTGRNVFDGEHDVNAIPNQIYHCYGTATITYKDIDGNTISSESKTNTTFTTPSNCISFGVSGSGNICISLYYEGESGYDQYYPYEEPANIDTGNEPLLAFDYKTPDGTIHRDTLPRIDLGTLEWKPRTGTTDIFYATPGGTKFYFNGICGKYAYADDIDAQVDKFWTCIAGAGHSIWVKDTAFDGMTGAQVATALSGVYFEAEADDSAKTTEQGTPFPENVAIDDFGTMAFDCPNGVPQGNTVFYPVDYKAEFDTLHNITEGDMHKIALKGELAPTDPDTIKGVVDAYNALYAINQENMGGALRHMLVNKVAAGGGTLAFADTAYVDLGSLNWSYNTTYQLFSAVISDGKLYNGAEGYSNGRNVCTKYAASTTEPPTFIDKTIACGTWFGGGNNAWCIVKDSAYTDAGAFKVAMKGILLAYEKATI